MWSDNGVTRPTPRTALLTAGLFLSGVFADGLLENKLSAQQPPAVAPAKPLQAQSPSGFTYSTNKDGQKIIDIRNVRYGVSGEGVPGLPPEQRLLLRISTRNRQVLDEVGIRATVLLEA